MSTGIVTKGLGTPFIITHGLGGGEAVAPIPTDVITDHITRALNLFITEFRQLRIITNGQRYIAPIPPPITPVITPSDPITDHITRALKLFITQFRQFRDL
jgi:hypothetical protein